MKNSNYILVVSLLFALSGSRVVAQSKGLAAVVACVNQETKKPFVNIQMNSPAPGSAIVRFQNGLPKILKFNKSSSTELYGCYVVTEKKVSFSQAYFDLSFSMTVTDGQPNTRCLGWGPQYSAITGIYSAEMQKAIALKCSLK